MKLNWFSPLPPARSAIATYATAALPPLARRADVTVWREAPSVSPPPGGGDAPSVSPPPGGGDVRGGSYRVEAPPWDEINRADVSLYHIGNHALFHAGIAALSRLQPGIVVLHDARLHEFVISAARLRHDRDGYVALMQRHYGDAGAAVAAEAWHGHIAVSSLVETFPCTAAFVDRALGVVVHSRDAFELAAASTAAPIVGLALPYRSARAAVPVRAWQAPFRLVMFGFLGGDRGLDAALRALGQLPEPDLFHLDVYGALPDTEAWTARAQAAGLARRVTFHGFVPAATLDAALDRAHLALNLRFPSRGEASFSLLQAWDHGLPAIVNRVGWFAELPDSCVAFAEPPRAAADIVHHLRALAADPARYREMGLAARERLLRAHAPSAYAQGLVHFATQALANRPRATALVMADRSAAALRDVAGSCVDRWSVQRIGAAIHGLNSGRGV